MARRLNRPFLAFTLDAAVIFTRTFSDVDVFVAGDERSSIFQPKATTSAMREAALASGFVCVNRAIMACRRAVAVV